MSAADEIRTRVAGRRVVASVSGGKDSAAMSLYLTELGIEHDRVFCDTGWEADETYAYLRDALPKAIGPITWLTPKHQMEALIERKAMFPSRVKRYCTQELKVFPIRDHLKTFGEDVRIVNAVGIRAAESAARAKFPAWEPWPPGMEGFDIEVWRPILTWTEAETIEIGDTRLFVCHRCDNPPCCNPAHLFLGTHQDNVDDKVAKGRQVRGTRARHAVLTEDQVREIRSRAAAGESGAALARAFGICASSAKRIISHKSWSWLS